MRNVEIKETQSQNMSEVYLTALEELALPHPSIKLPDWPTFNRFVGGLRSKEFTILCGSTGAGKTTFLANLSAQLLKQGVKHFVMSVETGHTDYMKRILSVLAGEDVNTGDPVSVEKLNAIHQENAKYLESGNIEFSLYDNRVPVEQLIYDLENMAEKGCKLAFIDNLNFFMEVVGDNHQIVEMDRTVHEIVMFCKKVDMHVILVMHPKKTSGQSTRVESEFDIKGSSTSVQEATNVWLFNRPRDEEVKTGRDRYERDLTLQKLRRRGRYSRHTIVFKNKGTRYFEGGFQE